MQDHMLFLLAVKQDDLIKSRAKFYMSGTKLLLLRECSNLYCCLCLYGPLPTITPSHYLALPEKNPPTTYTKYGKGAIYVKPANFNLFNSLV